MQITNLFWSENFGKQIRIGWDEFITCFSKFTIEYSKIQLQQTQKNYIKKMIDPANDQEITLKQFMNFLDSFWSIASNRTNVFKNKFVPNDVQINNGYTMMQILFEQGQSYQITPTHITNLTTKQTKRLSVNNFVTIGSSAESDITLDSIYCNPKHVKIVRWQKGYKIIDLSKSNRLLWKVDRSILLKANMVFRIGDHEITVKVKNDEMHTSHSYMDLDMTTTDITEMFNDYENIKNVNYQPDDDHQDCLSLIIRNIKTQATSQYSVTKTTRLGKLSNCQIKINDLKFKTSGVLFEYVNNWLLTPNEEDVYVYLASKVQMESLMRSNSQVLQQNNELKIRDVNITIKLVAKEQQY